MALLMNEYVMALLLGFGAIFAAYFKGRTTGAAKERSKHDAARHEAREDMTEVQNDVGALPPSKAREELRTWSK